MTTITVDDVWRVRGDWRAMRAAARQLRDERRQTAEALQRAALALRHGQELLGAILDRVDVPMTMHDDGRLTFYPADDADVAALRRAKLAAREIQAALETILAQHRSAL